MRRPKAWLSFGQETMLSRVVRLVGEVVGPVVVVAAPGQDLPELPKAVRIVRDPIEERGPLQAIATGLAALDGVELVYATATDMPFLRPGWIERLVSLVKGFELALPQVGEHLHPLAAIYRRDAAIPIAMTLLEQDRLRPSHLADQLRTRYVGIDDVKDVDPELASLRNLNSPEDYREALRVAGLADELGQR